jgi:hypothetical protein
LLNAQPRAWDRRCNPSSTRGGEPAGLAGAIQASAVGGCAISVGIRPLNGKATTAVMPCILLCRSSGGSPQPTTNPRDRVKKVEMTLCTFSLATSSPCGAAKSLSDRGTENTARRKDAADKTTNRAGATPLFRLSAAQKVRGVAPARHVVSCSGFATQRGGNQFVMQAALHLEKEKEERTWHY